MSSSSQTPASSSQFNLILDAALSEFEQKTGKDLLDDWLAKELQSCDSVEAVLDIIQGQAEEFDKFKNGSSKLMKWIGSSVHVLFTISTALGDGVGVVVPSTKAVFTGIGVLLAAAKDVRASHDDLVDLFERIQFFLKRLGVHTQISPTKDMVEILVKIVAEVLSILSIATKEMQRSRTTIYWRKLVGRTDIEDALKRLDSLTREEFQMAMAEVRMAIAQVLKSASELKHDTGTVQEIARNVDEMMNTVGQIKNNVDEIKWIHIEQDIRKWFSSPDPTVNYNTACEAYQEGTAAWFFVGSIFKEWEFIGSLLWIHGKPGSGKSILCTSIITHLISLREAGLATLAFFYFDFRDKEKQNVRNFLTSLLTQFSAYSEPCCGIISRLYSTNANGAQQPSVGVLKNCLKEMLRVVAHQPVYVILDALDECPDMSGMPTPRETVLSLMEDLVDMELPSLHLCVTSRPEVDIKDVLEPLAYCIVSLHDESGQQKDISDYVSNVVYSDKKMRKWRDGEKRLVIEELSEKADGMFRWVFCQLEVLRYCLPASIRQTLDQLPKTLDETYARVLSQIPQANQAQAHRMLQCLMVSVRPLRVEELAELLAFEFGTAQGVVPKYRADWKPHDKVHAVLSTCSSLIAIIDDHGSQVVQFSHFSVKEFLMSNRLGDFSQYQINPGPAHTILAQACLGSLLLLDDHADEETIEGYPLAEYAAEHWVTHAQFEDVASRVKDGMVSLFDCDKPHFAAWVRMFNIDHKPGPSWSPLTRPSWKLHHRWPSTPTPLYYSSLCGFSDLVEHLAIKRPQHVNDIGGQYEFPLLASLFNKHVRVAEILVEHGANLNIRGTDGRAPVHRAFAIEDVGILQFLLKHGADVNCQQDDLRTLLHLAADSRNLRFTRLLLEHHEADVGSRDKEGKTPFHLLLEVAIEQATGCDEDSDSDGDGDSDSDTDTDGDTDEDPDADTDTDADTDADTYTDGDSDTDTDEHDGEDGYVLPHARLLLEYGADANIRLAKDWTPLHLAVFHGIPSFARMLLDHGAATNAENNQGETPLHIVSRSKHNSQKHVDIAQLLLERGADANAGITATPLHSAAFWGRLKMTRVLLDHGADPNAENGQGETPLHVVSRSKHNSQKHVSIARLLLERGADANARSTATPLHSAVFWGRLKITRALLDYGADPNMKNDQGETLLHVVWRRRKHVGIARLLLERGAVANARSMATPLHSAVFWGWSKMIWVLLDYGADPNMADDQGETPLHVASRGKRDSEKNVGIARLLLERGADVNAWRKSKSTPLHLAAFRGMPEIVQVLLEHGANPNAENDQGETPLHLVPRGEYDSREGGFCVARLLLGHGVDVHTQDKYHDTALHSTAFWGMLDIAGMLLRHGANPDVENDQGETPLHLVSRGEYDYQEDGVDIALLLLERGVDVNAPDKGQNTPLHSASYLGRLKTTQTLLDYGAKDGLANDQARTPLHLVSQGSYWLQNDGIGVAKLLLECGADMNAQDKDHATPLHLACYRGRFDIARVLLEYDAKVQAEND